MVIQEQDDGTQPAWGSGRGKKAQAVWFPDGFGMGYEKKKKELKTSPLFLSAQLCVYNIHYHYFLKSSVSL